MDDLISRQAAIDAVVTWTVEDRPDIEMPTDLVARINALPAAQPEIIRCEDCRRRDDKWEDWEEGKVLYWCDIMDGCVKADDYCSYAERRAKRVND